MENYLIKSDIDKMFIDLVNNYGRVLPAESKEQARKTFRELLNMGFSFEWLYFALWNLGERNFITNKGLLFYKGYQEEVKEIVSAARRQYREYAATQEEIFSFFEIICDDKTIKEEDKERIEFYDDAYVNGGIRNFSIEEQKEISNLYIETYLKPLLKTTKKEQSDERQSLIEQLRDNHIFVDYKEIPLHWYKGA